MLSARHSSPFRFLAIFAFAALTFSGVSLAHAQSLRFAPVAYKVDPIDPTVSTTTLNSPQGVAVDAAGNLYIADTSNRLIRKVDPTQTATIFAGTGGAGSAGDGGLATAATFTGPYSIAADAAGNVYVGDLFANVVRKINPAGIISTFAGNRTAASSGDGGLAINAAITPGALATDYLGNVYIVDINANTVRVVNTAGVISTCAGGGTLVGIAGDNGPALLAQLAPGSIATDTDGNLYVGDGNTVREVTKLGSIVTYAGNGVSGNTGDGTFSYNSEIHSPTGLAVDSAGNLYISDNITRTIRVVNHSNIIGTIAGLGTAGQTFDGVPADKLAMDRPAGLAADPSGNVFIAVPNQNAVYRIVTHPEVFPQTALGKTSATQRIIVENTGASEITLSSVAITGDFKLGTAQSGAHPCNVNIPLEPGANNSWCTQDIVFAPTAEGIRAFPLAVTSNDTPTTLVETLASTGLGSALAMTSGQMFIVAGNHAQTAPVNDGDGGPAVSAALNGLAGLAVDSTGNIFVSEYPYCYIRRIDGNTGIISNYAGTSTGLCGENFSHPTGDGGGAIGAVLNGVGSLTLDASNNLYVADIWNSRIRVISPGGIINAFAGSGIGSEQGQLCQFSPDGTTPLAATLCQPTGLAADKNGNIYFAEPGNDLVRKIDTSGNLTTVAGNHALGDGYSGDGGLATSAQLNTPSGVAVNSTGDVFIADTYNNVIRKVSAVDGKISTIAGFHGSPGYTGDGGLASSAKVYQPLGLGIDAAGDIFIADTQNMVIRKIDTNGIITTVAGTNLVLDGFNGSGLAATATQLAFPNAVYVAASGSIYVSDASNGVIREMSPNGSLMFLPQNLNTTSNPQSVTLSNIGNMPLHFDSQFPTGVTSDFALATGGNCNFSAALAVGASCNINLTFTPTQSGTRNGIFGFFDDGVASPQYVALQGTGVQLQPQTIHFVVIPNHVYGDASFNVSATTNSNLPITFTVKSGGGIVSLSGSTITIHGTGPVTIAANQAGDNTWENAPEATRSFSINPTVLSVTASPATSQAGQPLAPLAYTTTGFVYSETKSVLTGAPTLSSSVASNGLPGTYLINIAVGTLSSPNYLFALHNGTYTLTPAPPSGPPATPTIILSASLVVTQLPNLSYQGALIIKNIGTGTASNVAVTSVKLGTAFSTTTPFTIGNIPAGVTDSFAIFFPASAGLAGTTVIETIAGTYTGGTYGGSAHLTLP